MFFSSFDGCKDEKNGDEYRDFSTVIRRSKFSYLMMCICEANEPNKNSTVMNIQKTTNGHTIYIIHTRWVSVFSMVYTVHCTLVYKTYTLLISRYILLITMHLQTIHNRKIDDESKSPKLLRHDTNYILTNCRSRQMKIVNGKSPAVFILNGNWLNQPKQVSLSSMVTKLKAHKWKKEGEEKNGFIRW